MVAAIWSVADTEASPYPFSAHTEVSLLQIHASLCLRAYFWLHVHTVGQLEVPELCPCKQPSTNGKWGLSEYIPQLPCFSSGTIWKYVLYGLPEVLNGIKFQFPTAVSCPLKHFYWLPFLPYLTFPFPYKCFLGSPPKSTTCTRIFVLEIASGRTKLSIIPYTAINMTNAKESDQPSRQPNLEKVLTKF